MCTESRRMTLDTAERPYATATSTRRCATCRSRCARHPAKRRPAGLSVPAPVRAGPMGARAHAAERGRGSRCQRAGDGADVPRGRCSARCCAPRSSPASGRRWCSASRRSGWRCSSSRCSWPRRRRAAARGADAARARVRGGARRPPVPSMAAVRVDRRCGHAARPRLRSGHQRPLLLGAVRAAVAGSTSRRPPICATWSGCRRISSSLTAARRSALIPTRYPGPKRHPDPAAPAGRKTESGARPPGRVSRAGPAAVDHRRRRTRR